MRPLLLFGVLLVVFTQVIRTRLDHRQLSDLPALQHRLLRLLPGDDEHGDVPRSPPQEGIVRKTQFPRLVIPLSIVLTGLFNLGMNLIAVLVFMLAFGVYPMWTWLLFPLVLLPLMIVFTAAVATALSALYVRRRDIGIIWSVADAGPLLRQRRPVSRSTSRPGSLQDLMIFNPLVPIFVQAHRWIIDPSAPSILEAGRWLVALLPAAIIFVGSASGRSGSSTARRRGSPRSSRSPGGRSVAVAVALEALAGDRVDDLDLALAEFLAPAPRPRRAGPAKVSGARPRACERAPLDRLGDLGGAPRHPRSSRGPRRARPPVSASRSS